MPGPRRERRFAPLWAYLFGLFALVVTQRLVFPPEDHTTTATAVFFGVGAVLVIVVLTLAERATRR